jgi:hypothetical protein
MSDKLGDAPQKISGIPAAKTEVHAATVRVSHAIDVAVQLEPYLDPFSGEHLVPNPKRVAP